jgi:hypothetical protein
VTRVRARVALMFTVLTSCGPIEYISTVTMQASRAVTQAKSSRAPELAPYEYTLAVEELHKARELAGHARWQQAIQFGRAALTDARKAQELAAEKGTRPSERGE